MVLSLHCMKGNMNENMNGVINLCLHIVATTTDAAASIAIVVPAISISISTSTSTSTLNAALLDISCYCCC
ncbi:hypothetical protein PP707_04320 [Acetobacter pasteurianus]|nr:hypothetical protein [Acetobacter pasteurianus]